MEGQPKKDTSREELEIIYPGLNEILDRLKEQPKNPPKPKSESFWD